MWNPLADRYVRRLILFISLRSSSMAATICGTPGSFGSAWMVSCHSNSSGKLSCSICSISMKGSLCRHIHGDSIHCDSTPRTTRRRHCGQALGILCACHFQWCTTYPCLVHETENLLQSASPSPQAPQLSIFQQAFIHKKLVSSRSLKSAMSLRPLRTSACPSIVLSSVSHATVYAYTSFFFIITFGILFHRGCALHTQQTGLVMVCQARLAPRSVNLALVISVTGPLGEEQWAEMELVWQNFECLSCCLLSSIGLVVLPVLLLMWGR